MKTTDQALVELEREMARLRAGWAKGGRVAAANMTPEQRRARAQAAARARWAATRERKRGDQAQG